VDVSVFLFTDMCVCVCVCVYVCVWLNNAPPPLPSLHNVNLSPGAYSPL